MPPRLLIAATTAAAALSLLLTACGSDDDAKSEDKIEGAGKSDESPASSDLPKKGAERPRIELPQDVKYAFEWKKTGDTDKDAVLRDVEQRIQAVDMALAEQDPLHKAYRFYSGGEAAVNTEKYVRAYVDEEARSTGTTRFYDAQVTIEESGTANLIYCEDQSAAFDMYLKTGEVDKTEPSKDSFIVHQSLLRENDSGIWVMEESVSSRGADECVP